MEVDDEGKFLLERIRLSKQHGNASIVIEVREHKVTDVKETLDYRRGKEFLKVK